MLSKYGLADWISRLNIEFAKDHFMAPDGEALARQSPESRIRSAMTMMGPTFIKIGQILSTRADLIGLELAKEFQKLQSDVPADPYEEIKETVEKELGQDLDSVFSYFSEEPIASASIGQVHRAELITGEAVVVKVQHTRVKKIVEVDLEIIVGLAQLAERLDDFKPYQPTVLAKEMSRTMKRELDFQREHRNLMQFHKLYENNPRVTIPKPYSKLCTERVLVMEFVAGCKLSDAAKLERMNVDLDSLARLGADTYLRMIFVDGFFHADPHPGNMLVCDDHALAILDFGMVGRISERLREDIEEMLLAIVNNDVAMMTSIIRRVGSVPAKLDEATLSRDVADFLGQYSTQAMGNFDLSRAINDMMSMIRSHKITLPNEAAMLFKVLTTLEGTSRAISSDINLMEVMQPLHRKLILKRLSPGRQFRKMRRISIQLEQLAESAPRGISNIIDQLQTGKFDIHLDHRRLGPSINRLVLGMLTSALFLGSSLMLSYKVPPVLFPVGTYAGFHEISIIGLFGILASLLLGMRLVWAIRKSGNLDKPDAK